MGLKRHSGSSVLGFALIATSHRIALWPWHRPNPLPLVQRVRHPRYHERKTLKNTVTADGKQDKIKAQKVATSVPAAVTRVKSAMLSVRSRRIVFLAVAILLFAPVLLFALGALQMPLPETIGPAVIFNNLREVMDRKVCVALISVPLVGATVYFMRKRIARK